MSKECALRKVSVTASATSDTMSVARRQVAVRLGKPLSGEMSAEGAFRQGRAFEAQKTADACEGRPPLEFFSSCVASYAAAFCRLPCSLSTAAFSWLMAPSPNFLIAFAKLGSSRCSYAVSLKHILAVCLVVGQFEIKP